MKSKFLPIFIAMLIIFFNFTIDISGEEISHSSLDSYFPVDVTNEHWAYEALDLFVSAGIVNGYTEGGKIYLRPEESITRAQFAKMIVNALDLKLGSVTPKEFSDVNPSNWHYSYVQIANSHGIILGSKDGHFHPNRKITRDELTVMIMRAGKDSLFYYAGGRAPISYKDVPTNYWAYEEITKASNLQIVNGYGVVEGYGNAFRPRNNATRAEAMVMLNRALQKESGNITSYEELQRILTEFFMTENNHYQQGSFIQLSQLYEETTTGYFKGTSYYWANYWNEVNTSGGGVSFVTTDQFKVIPIEISNRYVKITVRDLKYVYTKDGEQYETHANGHYFLRKYADGSWKIYNFYPFS